MADIPIHWSTVTRLDPQGRLAPWRRSSVYSVISRNWTSIWLLFVEFLDSVSQHPQIFFYFAGVDIHTEISLEIETKYIAGSNAFDPKEKVEGKVSKRLSNFFEPPQKMDQKSYLFTVGTPIEIERRPGIPRSLLWEVL